VAKLLAEEFTELGHEVTLLTLEKTDQADRFAFPVLRRPSPSTLWREAAACDVYWQNHIGLKTAWPALFLRKPWVVTLQGGLGGGIRAYLKRVALRRAVCVNISNFMAARNRQGSFVVGNPYDDHVFRAYSVTRSRELVFVGRLVPEKGPRVLLEVLRLLASEALRPRLTIVGDGQDRATLEYQAQGWGLGAQVQFVGVKEGPELAEILNRHQVLVIPSLWEEPFGIVALEGIACGCVVAAFDNGGLREAIGPCGVLVAPHDVRALANAISESLADGCKRRTLRARAKEHLTQFSRRRVALKYLEIFHSRLCPRIGSCEMALAPHLKKP